MLHGPLHGAVHDPHLGELQSLARGKLLPQLMRGLGHEYPASHPVRLLAFPAHPSALAARYGDDGPVGPRRMRAPLPAGRTLAPR